MKNKTAMIVCLGCNKLKHKDSFRTYFSFHHVTKRWCDVCQEAVEPQEEFDAKVKAERERKNNNHGEFSNHVDTNYSQQKRENKRRLDAIESAKFSEEWEL